jgi:hypothetical protein
MSELIITNDARQLVITRLACINSAVSVLSLLHGRPAKTSIEDVLHLAERLEAWAWRGLLPGAAEAQAPEASPVVRKNVVDMVIPPSSQGSRHDVRPSKIAWTIMPRRSNRRCRCMSGDTHRCGGSREIPDPKAMRGWPLSST